MKLKKLLFATAAIMMVTGTTAQKVNKSDICQAIPGLSIEQQQKIDKLSTTHQKTMDGLRTNFISERDATFVVNNFPEFFECLRVHGLVIRSVIFLSVRSV